MGKENYTWYQQNVHFISYNWDEEVVLQIMGIGPSATIPVDESGQPKR